MPEPVTDEITEQVSPHTGGRGKSRFPVFARLLGRWTTGGGFISRSRLSEADEALPEVPRNLWPSRVAIFLVASLFSFAVALAALRMHHCGAPTSLKTAEPPVAAPAPASAPPAAIATPAPHPLPGPAPTVAEPTKPLLPKQGEDSSPRTAPAAAKKAHAHPPNPSKVHTGEDTLLPIRP
ncbi:MAG TPA: hypothetical protein VF518_05025 [Polyangia bacterium]